MHYRHAFHAGNFADVLKHVVLVGVLECLSRKPSPWCWFDTHAGAGRYDLAGGEAQRTAEWRDGIGRVWQAGAAGGWLGRYRACLESLNPGGTLRYAPGSPLVAAALARADDRLVFCESQPEVVATLRRVLPARAVAIHCRDGYELPSLLPPAERRGGLLIDPPFERVDEFETVGQALEACARRFAGGIALAWYPVKNRHAADRFVRRMARHARGVDVRLRTGARGAGQMRECGMLVLQAPHGWNLAGELAALPELLSQGPGAGLEIHEFEAGDTA